MLALLAINSTCVFEVEVNFNGRDDMVCLYRVLVMMQQECIYMYMYIVVLSAVDVESQSLFGDSEDVEMQGGGRVTPCTTQTTLWVDKYAPRHYTHLLSDDVRK